MKTKTLKQNLIEALRECDDETFFNFADRWLGIDTIFEMVKDSVINYEGDDDILADELEVIKTMNKK